MTSSPLAAASNLLVRMFLAPDCAACHLLLDEPLAGPVCAACWRAVQVITPPCCVRCGDALASWRACGPLCARCRRQPPAFAIARSAGRYEGSLRDIIHAFKYERRRALADRLGALLREAGADALDGADAVIPVPLHPWRSVERGFNQADDLARQLGPPVWRVLRRSRHGPPQAGLPASRRHANVKAAFALGGAAAWPRIVPGAARQLRRATVVLVDDVMTTGATLDACARVLVRAGVRNVRALTVARAATPRPRPPTR